jgi:hypothetical protein
MLPFILIKTDFAVGPAQLLLLPVSSLIVVRTGAFTGGGSHNAAWAMLMVRP